MGPLNFKPLPKYGHYAGQIVFRSRFEDREKLNEAFVSVAADCKFPEELVNVSWDDETTVRPYSDDNAVQASNHYIHSDKEHYNFKKHSKQGFTKYVLTLGLTLTLTLTLGIDASVNPNPNLNLNLNLNVNHNHNPNEP